MIRFGRSRRMDQSDDVPEYWITYSDLMVSLLMAFALLLFLALGTVQSQIRQANETVGTIQAAIRSAADVLRSSGALVTLDSVSGTLMMNSEVLFAYNSAQLRPEAIEPIRRVASELLPRLLADPAIDTMIREITVEGHTDTVGTYMYNLQLSQDRAYSVMRAMVESTYGMTHAQRFRALVVASGKSEVRPILTGGVVDAARSRRIEVHIRLRDDMILRQVLQAAASSNRNVK